MFILFGHKFVCKTFKQTMQLIAHVRGTQANKPNGKMPKMGKDEGGRTHREVYVIDDDDDDFPICHFLLGEERDNNAVESTGLFLSLSLT